MNCESKYILQKNYFFYLSIVDSVPICLYLINEIIASYSFLCIENQLTKFQILINTENLAQNLTLLPNNLILRLYLVAHKNTITFFFFQYKYRTVRVAHTENLWRYRNRFETRAFESKPV